MERNDPPFRDDPSMPHDDPLDAGTTGYRPVEDTAYTPPADDVREERVVREGGVDTNEHGREAMGAGAGVLGGAAVGMAVAGPPGAVVGGAIGGIAGAAAGEASEGHDEAGSGAGALGGGAAGAVVGGVIAGPPGAVVGAAVGAGAGAGTGDKTEETAKGEHTTSYDQTVVDEDATRLDRR